VLLHASVNKYVLVKVSLHPLAAVTSLELIAIVEQASLKVPPARVKSAAVA